MVKFILAEETPQRLVYLYYPEGDQNHEPGMIVCNRETNEIEVTKVAEEDYERKIPVDEMNDLIEAINQMKTELGETDFLEMETEPERSIVYGDHAISRIRESLKEGKILKEGTVLWY